MRKSEEHRIKGDSVMTAWCRSVVPSGDHKREYPSGKSFSTQVLIPHPQTFWLPWSVMRLRHGYVLKLLHLILIWKQDCVSLGSGPITSWEIDGETVETVSDFIFWGSKIIAVGDCSHEIKRRLVLGRNVMTNLDGILKSRDIALPTKFRLVKAMVFPMVMYGCEIWTVKNAEHRRIDAFELWCWRRLLRILWTARRSD